MLKLYLTHSFLPLFLPSFFLVEFLAVRLMLKGEKGLLLKNLESSERLLSRLGAKDEKLESELKALDEKASEIAGLYDLTKQLSSTLLFGELFEAFSEFLKRNFKFAACGLILLDKEKKETAGPYKIDASPEAVTKVAAHEPIEIPLISQDGLIGRLNVEGLEEASVEKFLIVSRQLGLEIERVRLYEMVQELAVTDGLTGIFVRRYFLELFKEEFERSLRHRFKLSFLIADLDHFKDTNDRFGHLVGDAVLKGVACLLRQSVREIDIIARYGGEEFSLLLPETDKASAMAVAERVRESVARQEFKPYDEQVRLTISVGVATFPDDAKGISDLIGCADNALYKAKAGGRNRIVGFER